jgi:glycosyltransferase involved in cell wall biosynthesis
MTVSVVIITKNEAATIGLCVAAAKQITDDVILIDNGSTDGTTGIAHSLGCRVYYEQWDGYGANKNKGIALARHDWVLSLDADEIPDEALIAAIKNLKAGNINTVYDISFKAYYGQKHIRYGNWGRDHHIRLFNRSHTQWTDAIVHETLKRPADTHVQKLAGHIHHYSVKSAVQYKAKIVQYARLNARKYLLEGKKPTLIKLYIAPVFHFVKGYIFLLGILDGKHGWTIAKMMAEHTWLKYHFLSQQTGYKNNGYFAKENFSVVEY